MAKSRKTTIPYSNISYGTEPTRYIRFVRTCFFVQIIRFLALNLKVMKIVVKGHS